MNKVYRVYCNGFAKTFETLASAQAFIDQLRGMNCVGHEIVVSVGRGTISAAVFTPGRNERREILKAAA